MIWLINTLIRVTEQSNSSLPSKIRHIYFDSNAENNDNDIKFQVGDYATISKYKNIFAKVYTQNFSEEFFLLTKSKNHSSMGICNRKPYAE